MLLVFLVSEVLGPRRESDREKETVVSYRSSAGISNSQIIKT